MSNQSEEETNMRDLEGMLFWNLIIKKIVVKLYNLNKYKKGNK